MEVVNHAELHSSAMLAYVLTWCLQIHSIITRAV